MKKLLTLTLLMLIALAMFAPVAFAVEQAVPSDAKLKYYGMAVLGSAFAIGVAGFGAAIGMGMGISKACDGVARNPAASGKITTTLIIGLALIESLAIYALVVVLIVLFVNPFGI